MTIYIIKKHLSVYIYIYIYIIYRWIDRNGKNTRIRIHIFTYPQIHVYIPKDIRKFVHRYLRIHVVHVCSYTFPNNIRISMCKKKLYMGVYIYMYM